jgi:dienelactone hydrolase
LVAAGYRVLMVDSFGSRGVVEICTENPKRIRAGVERSGDAHRARRWVVGAFGWGVDGVHLIGWSNGGTAALSANVIDAEGRQGGEDFATVTAYYPGCGPLSQGRYVAVAPTLIQAAASDDWTPSVFCERLVEKHEGARMWLDVYPDAHHGFDRVDMPVRFRPDVRNRNREGGLGATVGAHPSARVKAIERTLKFIAGRGF